MKHSLLFLYLTLCISVQGQRHVKGSPGLLWDVQALSSAPRTQWLDTTQGVYSLLYESVPYRGEKTEVFAYYSNPDLVNGRKSTGTFPGVVLVHGGGGKAYSQWVEKWARAGYAAIAMDLSGKDGQGNRLTRGGPDQTDKNKIDYIETGALQDVWTSHAVASILLAHSLLLDRPEVNREKTAITGISWGGYLTCLAAAIDPRFKAAAPVYGCGYYNESEVFGPLLDKLSPEKKKEWMTYFDPSSYLHLSRAKFLFLNGNKDRHYNVVPYARTYGLVPAGSRVISIKPDMKHSHEHGWEPRETEIFFESVLNGGIPLPSCGEVHIRGNEIGMDFTSETRIKEAAFYYTADAHLPATERRWHRIEVPVDVAGGRVSCTISPAAFNYGFFLLKDERDLSVSSAFIAGEGISLAADGFNPKAKWITNMRSQSATNTWLAFRKVIEVDKVPEKAITQIAVDSKYWLWINGRQVVFEGGLKRGPNPSDTYYDELDIAPYLRKGKNTIAVQVWYFGKHGFSHHSSGKAGLLFSARIGSQEIISDASWKSMVLKAFGTAGGSSPNFRLPESSLLYDARLDPGKWWDTGFDDHKMTASMEIGKAGSYPWNQLVKRPIPLWKDYGLKDYTGKQSFPFVSTGDTLACDLPYNAQVTPYLEVEAGGGEKIEMFTDNYLEYNGGDTGIHAEYITQPGVQAYESPGWMNGHKMYYLIPRGVKVLGLKFRETGYDTEFTGQFHSSDEFLNLLWKKAVRSVYVNMRDTYMDCPERERAQWPGDQVHESAQAFFMFDAKAHSLARKYLYETLGWQKANGSLFGPVPAGNWDQELPEHILSAIGYYGIRNYYMHTGDVQTLKDTYHGIKKYLALWEPDGRGTMQLRPGDWTWGDWGKEKDLLLIYNLWYYLAIKSMQHTAELIGEKQDALQYQAFLNTFEASFNEQFWTGSGYRSPGYTGKTDDRVQALAVVAGIASAAKYPAIGKVLETERHCSPFMEKFVLEAMFRMGYGDKGLERFRSRFDFMVNHPYFTTLFEGWGIGPEGYGGGSVNHGWGGAGTVVILEELVGIKPLTAQYRTFQVLPALSPVSHVRAVIPTVSGNIEAEVAQDTREFNLRFTVPAGTSAITGVPAGRYSKIFLNNRLIWNKNKAVDTTQAVHLRDIDGSHTRFSIKGSGTFELKALK